MTNEIFRFATRVVIALACFVASFNSPSFAANDESEQATRGDDSVIAGRVRVALNRPAPPSREFAPTASYLFEDDKSSERQTPDAPKPNDEEKATRSANKVASDSLEIIGKEIADFRLKSGNGRYILEDELGAIRIIPQESIESVSPAPDTTLGELRAKIKSELLKEFGADFTVKETDRFFFVSDASEGYVEWCARLFESLASGFRKYAEKWDIPIKDRAEPLIVLIFASQSDFIEYASVETQAADKLAAYYNMQTNRVALYDLSYAESDEGAKEKRRKRTTAAETREFLSRPNAAFNVATIVHEATHQISFNFGVFLRTGPVALWSAEGLALTFETPNGRVAQNGWSYRPALPTNERLRALFLRRVDPTKDPFRKTVEQDGFYNDLESSYASSWALFYYLYKKRPKDLARYMKHYSEKHPCLAQSPEERVADFESFFGKDWEKLTTNVVKFVQKL